MLRKLPSWLRSPYSTFSFLVYAIVFISCNEKATNDDDNGPIHYWTPTLDIDVDPAWSPDGKTIIYFREFANGYNYEDTSWTWGVFLHDVSTGRDSLLWENYRAFDLDWSPDGKSVALSHAKKIYIRDLVSGDTTRIYNPSECFCPRWSPCGDKLIFFDRDGIQRGMYYYDFSNNMTNKRVPFATAGGWFPGCDSIAVIDFSTSADGQLAIYSMTHRTLRKLSPLDGFKRTVTVSPDGRTILFSRDIGTNYVNIWKYDMLTAMYGAVTMEGGDNSAWSPDGNWIAYTKLDSLNGHLWLMRPDGSEKHQITF